MLNKVIKESQYSMSKRVIKSHNISMSITVKALNPQPLQWSCSVASRSDCGCTGQLPGMNVELCEWDQGVPAKESLPLSEPSLNRWSLNEIKIMSKKVIKES